MGDYFWDLVLTTDITHPSCGDLDITLMSPEKTIVTVSSYNGGKNAYVFNGTVWSNKANLDSGPFPYFSNKGLVTDHPCANKETASPLTPQESFDAFIGENPKSDWTPTIRDKAGNGGNLNSWSLVVTTFPSKPMETTASITNSDRITIPQRPWPCAHLDRQLFQRKRASGSAATDHRQCGFYEFVHNACKRGKALLGSLHALLLT